jgi:CBS domain containing-hemolysin-like protein
MDDEQRSDKAGRPDASSQPGETASEHSDSGLWDRVKGMFGAPGDASLRESLQDVIEQHGNGNGNGDMRPQERSMMLNLLEFAELRVDDVLVPRADIIAIDDEATTKELLSMFVEANHSRVPVYHETLDDPLGMVHIKDLVRWMSEQGKTRSKASANGSAQNRAAASFSLSAKNLSTTVKKSGLIREVLFVPPSMRAGELLIRMQTSRIHMAIVVDEYGGTDGLVSIEDLVEEIVGDISDEHDDNDASMIRKVDAGLFSADARAPVEQLEELLGVDLLPDEQDEDVDTLGGLVFSMLGRVPVRGELIKHPRGIEFEVTSADLRRIKRLRIHMHGRTGERIAAADPVKEN